MSGARPCGYELREVISLEGVSVRVVGLALMNNPKAHTFIGLTRKL